MQSTELNRIWNDGPPPHVGWWNASNNKQPDAWRWWFGFSWSKDVCSVSSPIQVVRAAAQQSWQQSAIQWSDYWPENARVPRIDPRAGVPTAPPKPHRHEQNMWVIAGGRWRWCYQCGAIKSNTAPKGTRWNVPTGIGGPNPTTLLLLQK
jgi:hypothetical protein